MKYCCLATLRVIFLSNSYGEIQMIFIILRVRIGGASVNLHMLNNESRKYFNRAFLMSSTALNYYALSDENHLERMKKFANIQDEKQLVEYLKKTKNIALSQIESNADFGVLLDFRWGPTVESAETEAAFITKTAKEIYESDDAPAMDTMFSFTSQVFKSNAVQR